MYVLFRGCADHSIMPITGKFQHHSHGDRRNCNIPKKENSIAMPTRAKQCVFKLN